MLGLTGCPSDDVPAETNDGTSTGDPSTSSPVTITTADTTDGVDTTAGENTSTGEPPSTEDTAGSSSGTLPPPEPADFVVTIRNVSDTGLMFSPLSPGVWANHEPNADTLFDIDVADDKEGLEALAEDGDPTDLLAAVMGHAGINQAGVFDTPVTAGAPGPLLPGDTYEFTFTADPGTRLSLGTMLVGSNDLVIASAPVGISLFAGGGQPLGERDVSSNLRIWDAGTEVNQAPAQGPWQALHGGSPNMGPPEGDAGVFPYEFSTRALPLGPDLVSVDVADDAMNPGTFIITITNVSGDRGALVTPLSPILWATHTDAIALFAEGEVASPELEALAEDGDAGPLDTLLGGSAEVGQHAVLPGVGGPIMPGESVQFSLTPDPAFPLLNLASMVGQTNDAFLSIGAVGDATATAGVPLFDGAALRDNQDIEADILAHLTPWDAGTELNEVPGVGPNQAPRQVGPNTGPADPVAPEVHRYADVTNDLAGDSAGDFLLVEVNAVGGDYTITITNTSGGVFPGLLTPVVWALHDASFSLFDVGVPASPGLEMLAEDGDGAGLLGEIMGMAGVVDSGVETTHAGPGPGTMGPLLPGDSYQFTVTPDATHRFLSFASMVVPSNDTFVSVSPGGVALMTAGGALIAEEAVAADIAAQLSAWDAGTEGNQAGAGGRDMAPYQAGPNVGPGNGNSLVREADEDEIWSLPSAEGLIQVIVAPVK